MRLFFIVISVLLSLGVFYFIYPDNFDGLIRSNLIPIMAIIISFGVDAVFKKRENISQEKKQKFDKDYINRISEQISDIKFNHFKNLNLIITTSLPGAQNIKPQIETILKKINNNIMKIDNIVLFLENELRSNGLENNNKMKSFLKRKLPNKWKIKYFKENSYSLTSFMMVTKEVFSDHDDLVMSCFSKDKQNRCGEKISILRDDLSELFNCLDKLLMHLRNRY
jgi:hypothetical protein